MSDDEDGGEKTYQVIFDDEPGKAYEFLPRKDGKATATFPNGDTYVGEYKEGKKHGKGCYTYMMGAKYDGEYNANRKEGFGTFYSPDKGKYTGQWVADKRSGEGTYVYPNGDAYTGVWKNGAKHGKGCYTYKGIGSSISGTWSNNQCVDGDWNQHDGSKYTGAFLSNQPSGNGLVSFPNGNLAAGAYQQSTFTRSTFVRPHPTAPMPEPRKAEPFAKACRAVDKAPFKSDHFNEMHRIKAVYDGVPNFRRAAGTNVIGCGQPSADGFKQMSEALAEAGLEKITMVNVRDDPVVYVSGLPFAPRDSRDMDEPLRVGLASVELGELEKRVMDNVKFQVKKKGMLLDYSEDKLNPETLVKTTDKKTIMVKELDDVKSVQTMHDFLAENDVPIEYKRVPMVDDKAPAPAELDALAKVVREIDGGGIVIQDAQGGTKTTMAMTVALVMLGTGGGGDEEEEEGGDDEEGGETAPKKKGKEEEVYDEMSPDYEKAQYEVVMSLVTLLNGPDPEVERKKRLEEEAKLKAEEDERKKAEEEAKKEAEAGGEGDEAAAAVEGEAKEEGGEEGGEGDEPVEGEGEEKKEEGGEGEADEAPVAEAPLVWVKTGNLVKAQVDEILDKIDEMGNLRKAVLEVRTEHELASEEQKAPLQRKAANFLERYCYLLLFAAYHKALKEGKLEAPKAEPTEGEEEDGGEEEDAGPQIQTFETWCSNNTELTEALGTRTEGALAEFAWS